MTLTDPVIHTFAFRYYVQDKFLTMKKILLSGIDREKL